MSRRRYRWDDETQQLVEVPLDYRVVARNIAAPVTDLYMDGVRTTDGIDIGSRAKRREYMRAAGVADASDYTETWAKAAKEREAFVRGEHNDPGVREAIARSAYQLTQGKRR